MQLKGCQVYHIT